MPEDRQVAGIRCSQVLALLSGYVDGELDEPDVKRIEAHLAGCDWCEKFGGEFAGVVRALRRELAKPAPLDDEVAERLREKLRAGTSSG